MVSSPARRPAPTGASTRGQIGDLAADRTPLRVAVQADFEVAHRCNSRCTTWLLTVSPPKQAGQLALNGLFKARVNRAVEGEPWPAGSRPPRLAIKTAARGAARPYCIAPFTDARFVGLRIVVSDLEEGVDDGAAALWHRAHDHCFRDRLSSSELPTPCRNCGLAWSR